MQDLAKLDLVFRLGSELVGVPVRQVREVAPFDPASAVPVPRAPDFVEGVIGHHGRIVVLVDLRRFLDLRAEEPAAAATHLVVLAREDVALGVPCQGVARISALPPPEEDGPADVVQTDLGPVRRVDLDTALGRIESYFG